MTIQRRRRIMAFIAWVDAHIVRHHVGMLCEVAILNGGWRCGVSDCVISTDTGD